MLRLSETEPESCATRSDYGEELMPRKKFEIQKIYIRVVLDPPFEPEETSLPIMAECIGQFAVHRNPDGVGYVITDMPSGRQLRVRPNMLDGSKIEQRAHALDAARIADKVLTEFYLKAKEQNIDLEREKIDVYWFERQVAIRLDKKLKGAMRIARK